jgi:dienelactone hydrolase
MKKTLALAFLLAAGPARAALVTKTIEYKEGKTVLEGYLAYDDSVKGLRPGIVVVHDWMGMGDFPRQKAEDLAKLGYIALAADIYGKGVRPKDAKEASGLATKFKAGDRALLRARAKAALDTLLAQPQTDAARVAAIGFCFGGTAALELARTGAPLTGVVVFHGGLDTPNPKDANSIKGKILALQGADDPYVGPDQVAGFEKEMRDAKVDWTLVQYSGAVHAFMIPAAGSDNSKGAAYNPVAARRAWKAMQDFFGEIF